jgi:xanthine dehydrogenase YagS FAD-binding subunit
MRPFEYASGNTVVEISKLLGTEWGEAEILAGGTDLLSLMKDDVVHPKRLVNMKHCKLVSTLEVNDSGARIGALVTLAELGSNANIIKTYPALAEAVNEAASPQIRNMATLGGNLCQRPRCWYFRNGFGLIPTDEKGRDMVEEGDSRFHAILGNSGPAKFVSPSTIVPILIVHRARVRTYSPKGLRQVWLGEIYKTPKNNNEREHDLDPNEVIAEIIMPLPTGIKAAHYEIRQKEVFDWPLAVAAVGLQMDGNKVTAGRIVLGSVAPVPWRCMDAEQYLIGKEVTPETAWVAAQKSIQGAKALPHNDYKIWLAEIAVKRALLKAVNGGAA